MEKLKDRTVADVVAEVGQDSPAPGGGSAAALAGSVAAALVAMVCRLSRGREDVAASDDEIVTALEEAERLQAHLLDLVDEDTAAFDVVMQALRMPKADEAQRTARSAALVEATLGAADVPLQTLEAAQQTLQLAGALVGRVNPGTASDLGVAVELARSCAEGALLNVGINLYALPPSAAVTSRRRTAEARIGQARRSSVKASEAIRRSLGLDS